METLRIKLKKLQLDNSNRWKTINALLFNLFHIIMLIQGLQGDRYLDILSTIMSEANIY